MRKVNFSETSVKNLEYIKFYLISKWSERVYGNFKTKLSENISLIATNPEAFPKSNKNIYKCVLIKSQFFTDLIRLKFKIYLFSTLDKTQQESTT